MAEACSTHLNLAQKVISRVKASPGYWLGETYLSGPDEAAREAMGTFLSKAEFEQAAGLEAMVACHMREMQRGTPEA